jgi:hypothetical protein
MNRPASSQLLMLLLLLLPSMIWAQSYVDLVKFSYQATPLNTFDAGTGKTRVSEFNGELMLPLKVGERTFFVNNLTYEQTSVKIFESTDYEGLRSFTLRTGLMINHSEKLTGTYLFVPRVSSDLNSSFGDGLQLGGLVLFKIAQSSQTNIKLGLFASTEFFSAFVTPLLGYYRLSDDGKWEINGLLPASFAVSRKLSSRFDAGLSFNGQIKGFRLREVESTGQPGYLARTSNDFCASLKMQLVKNMFLQLRVGRTLGRSYRVYDAGDKLNFAISFIKFDNTRAQLNTDFADGWIGQVVLFYRMPTN